LVPGERLAAAGRHRAMHEDALLALGRASLRVAVDDALLVVDVDPAEDSADLPGDFRPAFLVDVEDRHPGARTRQRLRGGPSQAGGAAGDDCADARIDFHSLILLPFRPCSKTRSHERPKYGRRQPGPARRITTRRAASASICSGL